MAWLLIWLNRSIETIMLHFSFQIYIDIDYGIILVFKVKIFLQETDIEQTAMAFLDFDASLRSSRKAKRHQQKSWAPKSESHEIWRAEAKWPSEQQRHVVMRYPLKMENSFIQAPKTAFLLFIVIFVSLITFCSKVKIKSRLFSNDPQSQQFMILH